MQHYIGDKPVSEEEYWATLIARGAVTERPTSLLAQALTLDAIAAEVVSARLKHPGRNKLFVALVEEVGELAQAMLQCKPKDEIEREAIQVAAQCVRIIEETDADFDVVNWSTKS